MNCEQPFSPRQAISPSSTASVVRRKNSIPAHRSVKLEKRFPFREIRRTPDGSRCRSARNPSYFSSKSQSGSENGSGRLVSGKGWKSGSFTDSSIAANI